MFLKHGKVNLGRSPKASMICIAPPGAYKCVIQDPFGCGCTPPCAHIVYLRRSCSSVRRPPSMDLHVASARQRSVKALARAALSTGGGHWPMRLRIPAIMGGPHEQIYTKPFGRINQLKIHVLSLHTPCKFVYRPSTLRPIPITPRENLHTLLIPPEQMF